MTLYVYIAIIVFGVYSLIILRFALGWYYIKPYSAKQIKNPISVSIIVACRNEERNISQLIESLLKQTYSPEHTEIMIVDDHSEDNTVKIIKTYTEKHRRIKLYKLPNNKRGKKEALETAVKEAKADLIMTTDADCILQSSWISTFISFYLQHRCKLIVGPVVFKHKYLFDKLQTLEFISLVGSGAGAIGIHRPIMSNGANLLFEKALYTESNQHKNFASGDDIFLLLHAKRKDKHGIRFIKSQDAIVYTHPASDLNQLINQRARWASKSKAYHDFDLILTALTVSFTNLILIMTLIISFFNSVFFTGFLILFAVKSLIDLSILFPVARFLNQQKLFWYLIPLQLIYPFYITLTVILGLKGNFKWKDRSFK